MEETSGKRDFEVKVTKRPNSYTTRLVCCSLKRDRFCKAERLAEN